MYQEDVAFSYQNVMKWSVYSPEVPDYIISDLIGSNKEPIPVKYTNTKNKLKSKKQNIMKKGLSKIGKGIAKGTCKVLGGTHFVIQSTADIVCATEASIRALAFDEDKMQAYEDRQLKTSAYQMQIAERLTALRLKAEMKIDELKSN